MLGRCFCLSLPAHHHTSPSYLIKACVKRLNKKCLVHAVVFYKEFLNGNCLSTAYGLDGPGIESRCGKIFRTNPDRP